MATSDIQLRGATGRRCRYHQAPLPALAQTLERAVAFHHADMTSDERGIVERATTSALVVGRNVSAKNVVLDGRRWEANGPFDRPALIDLGKSEYEDISGRASRVPVTSGFGRSILVTHSRQQAQDWLEAYTDGDFEAVVPTLRDEPIEDIAIDLIASGMAKTRHALTDILLATFTGAEHWTNMRRKALSRAISTAIDICAEGGLVRQGCRDAFSITKTGMVAASSMIGAETAAVLARWAQAERPLPPAPIEIFTLLGQSMAGGDVYVRYSYREDREVDYKRELIARLRQAGLRKRSVFAPYTGSSMALETDEARVVKKALMLQDWIDEVPMRDVEQRYDTWAGSIRRIGEEYGWLCEGLAAICAACGWGISWRRRVEELAERVAFGVKEDAVDVMKLRVPCLGRGAVASLRDSGLLGLRDLREAAPERVKRVLGSQRLVDALLAKLAERPAQREEPGQGGAHADDEPQPQPILAADDARDIDVASAEQWRASAKKAEKTADATVVKASESADAPLSTTGDTSPGSLVGVSVLGRDGKEDQPMDVHWKLIHRGLHNLLKEPLATLAYARLRQLPPSPRAIKAVVVFTKRNHETVRRGVARSAG